MIMQTYMIETLSTFSPSSHQQSWRLHKETLNFYTEISLKSDVQILD